MVQISDKITPVPSRSISYYPAGARPKFEFPYLFAAVHQQERVKTGYDDEPDLNEWQKHLEECGIPHVLALVPGSTVKAVRRKNGDGSKVYGTNRIIGLWVNHKYDNEITRIREKRAYKKRLQV